MRRVSSLFAIVVVFLLGVIGYGQDNSNSIAGKAAVPRLVRFSGVAKEAAGKPQTGVTDLTFSLYREEEGGEALWFETQTVQTDAQGRYSVLLGAMHPDGLPADLFTSGEARWLGVSVGKLPEQPRVLLVSVPYAMKAEDAEKLGGRKAADYVLAEQLKEEVKTAVSLQVLPVAQTTVKPQAALTSPTGTSPAITSGASSFACNTTTPCVTVSQTSTGTGIQSSAKTLAVYGVASQTTGTTYGVRGQTPSTSGQGVLGYATGTTGGTIGVHGLVPSTSGIGVYGESTGATGATRGVIGRAASTSGIGVFGYDNATSGSTTGVRGDVWSPAGIAGIFDNRGGGKILSARAIGKEIFGVNGDGSLSATAASLSGLTSDQIVKVTQSGTGHGIVVSNSSTGSLATAIWAQSTGGSGQTYGLRASVDSQQGTAVEAITQNGRAIRAVSNASRTILAENNNPASGDSVVVDAYNESPAGIGVYGHGSGTGVQGRVNNGSTGIPGVFWNPNSSGKILSGRTASPTPTEVFSVAVDGTVTAGGLVVDGTTLAVDAANNRVGIGTATPSTTLDVQGNIQVGTSALFPGCITNYAGSIIAGTCVAISDARLKTRIEPFAPLLDRLVQLRPVSFDWKADQYPKIAAAVGESRSFGLIAQEVEAIFPELVVQEGGLKGVRYDRLPLLLLQGVRELKADNDYLRQRVTEQQAQINGLKAAIRRLGEKVRERIEIAAR